MPGDTEKIEAIRDLALRLHADLFARDDLEIGFARTRFRGRSWLKFHRQAGLFEYKTKSGKYSWRIYVIRSGSLPNTIDCVTRHRFRNVVDAAMAIVSVVAAMRMYDVVADAIEGVNESGVWSEVASGLARSF